MILTRKSIKALPQGNITSIYQKRKQELSRHLQASKPDFSDQKILESFVRDKIVEYIMSYGLFADGQHGFVLGRSCMSMTQILVELEESKLC